MTRFFTLIACVCTTFMSYSASAADKLAITAVYPTSLIQGVPNVNMAVLGTDITPGTVVYINGTAERTVVQGSTMALFTLPVTPASVQVTMHAANGAVSKAFSVQVVKSPGAPKTAPVTVPITIPTPVSTGPTAPATTGHTWYVRPDGGTRYSANMPTGQCDGLADVAYPGSGQNQHCAFKDVRYFWQDGSYSTGNNYPAWGWIGSGGDVYFVRGSIGTGVTYRIGWNNNASAYDATTEQSWGISSDPYDSFIPPPPSGTAAHPTRFLGENYASCSAQSSRTQLHGGNALYEVMDFENTSYVDVECFDITQFSNCALTGSATTPCNTNPGEMTDHAKIGINFRNTATHITLNNIRTHGLSGSGWGGPTGDGFVATNVDIIGNASSGWNSDSGSGDANAVGRGSALIQNFNISWNGCKEEYPIKDTLPYAQCTDDNNGGYGDGFGTATVLTPPPGWQVHFDQGTVSYNTQDGLDALHLVGTGSSMTITRVLAFGNMGQQIKVGGASGTAENNVITTNCNALRQNIPGTPSGYNTGLSDFCRAADTGVLLTLGKGSSLSFDNNTIYSATATGVEVECDTTNGACDSTSKVDFRNNIFVGFLNNPADGYTGAYDTGTGDYSNPIYDGTGLFGTTPGSYWSNNLTFHPKSNWTCPARGESNALCVDPLLTDETWHNYGYANVEPTAKSPTLGKGVVIPAITVDFNGVTRSVPPAIGALQQ